MYKEIFSRQCQTERRYVYAITFVCKQTAEKEKEKQEFHSAVWKESYRSGGKNLWEERVDKINKVARSGDGWFSAE